ncbi:hypothetical protein [Roseateles sp. LYH14W]|uniref:Uncharacterized protein n=1 Tax=Pelomonas parva TaxID=3299032 RepID=A0ABW7F3X5_9BURK
MKSLLLAAALLTLSVTAPAGAARDVQSLAAADRAQAVMVADAGRLGSASLTALNDGPWTTAERRSEPEAQFGNQHMDVDTGMLLLGLGVLAFMLSRPAVRALRRQEQQRRAAALASTLQGREHG